VARAGGANAGSNGGEVTDDSVLHPVGPNGVAAVRFRYPPRDVLAKAVRIGRERLLAAVRTAEVIAVPGQELRLPPRGHVSGRYALLMAVADTAAACSAALDEATAAVCLDVLRELH